MAKKVLRNRSQITSTIDPKMHDILRDISEQTDIPISKLLDKSIELLKNDFINKGLYNESLLRDSNRELGGSYGLPRDESYKININLPDNK